MSEKYYREINSNKDINEIETKISLHRVSCEDHNHQGLT